jgi:hypothetical protein
LTSRTVAALSTLRITPVLGGGRPVGTGGQAQNLFVLFRALEGIPSPPLSASYLNSGERRFAQEDLGEIRPSDPSVLDVDGLEHRVVEASAYRRSCLHVRDVAVVGESDGGAKDVLSAGEIALRDRELGSGRLLSYPDPVCSAFRSSSGIAFA